MDKTAIRARLDRLRAQEARLEKQWKENVEFGGPAFANPKKLNAVAKEVRELEDLLKGDRNVAKNEKHFKKGHLELTVRTLTDKEDEFFNQLIEEVKNERRFDKED